MKILSFRLTILAMACACGGVQAQTTVSTAPVGFNSVSTLGNSDTRFSVPLHRPAVYAGLVQSVSGTGGNIVTAQGTPGWTTGPDQFVYAQGTQSNTYYIEFTSGNKVGMTYTVADNSTNTLTLDLNGDALDGSNGTGAVAAGDSFSVIPYWTLGTLFPSGQGVTAAANVTGSGSLTQILVISGNAEGINLAPNFTYYYYGGNGTFAAGWRQIGGGFTTLFDDTVVSSDQTVVIRQNGVSATSVLTATGTVPTNQRSYVIGTIQANAQQDNWIGIDVPIALTLAQSNLATSGAFTGASNVTGTGGDELLVFDDTVAGYNKAPNSIYYYYGGNGTFAAGWRKVGGGFTTLFDSTAVFQPGSGYIIRKQATSVPTSAVWSLPLPY